MPNYAVMFQGHQREASQRYGGKYDIQPVWGLKFNGKSERKIHQTKESLKKSVSNQRLSVLQWDAIAAEINKS